MHLKESYESIEILFNVIQYNEYNWYLCGDLKIIGILMGMQRGFTKHCFFLCLWDSRATAVHYVRKDWPAKVTYIPRNANIKEVFLADPKNVLIPTSYKIRFNEEFCQAAGREYVQWICVSLQQVFQYK